MFRRIAASIFALVVLVGCAQTPVVQEVTQSQANEIVAVLAANGISAVAEEERGGRGLFTVLIGESNYTAAVSLLHQRGLPGERRASVQELLAPSGLIPSSREVEAMRLDLAVAAQIEDLVASHPAVAHVRSVARVNFLAEGQKPGVSIIIQQRPGLELNKDSLLGVVTSAVPGITRESISINIEPARVSEIEDSGPGVIREGEGVRRVPLVPFLVFWHVPEGEYLGLALSIICVVLLVGIGAAGLGYWTCLFQRSNDDIETNLPEVLPKSFKIEKVRRDGM